MSFNRQQTSARGTHGSRVLDGDRRPSQALAVDQTQGGARVCLVFQRAARPAAAARTGLVATGSVHFISIALRAQPARCERGRGLVLPSGRRAARVASRLPRLAKISCRSLSAERQAVEPTSIDVCFPEPFIEPTHRLPSSFVASDVKQHSERQNGTVLYHRGEFHDQQGAPQHESC